MFHKPAQSAKCPQTLKAIVAPFNYRRMCECCTLAGPVSQHKLCLSCANADTVVGQAGFSPTETLLTNSTWSEASRVEPGPWKLS